MIDDEEDVFYEINGKEYCNEELALSILLENEVLFCNQRYIHYNKDDISEKEMTICLFVNCNDVFYWGCADAESLTLDDLVNLYKLWNDNNKWGSTKWVCMKRNRKPQKPIEDDMKKDGYWDVILENLESNL